MSDAIVVGGGIAGLVVARAIALAGRPVTLLEASGRLGGTVARHRVGGIDLDSGAESFATRRGTVAALATELGLGSEIVTPAGSGAWLLSAEGVAHPLPATSLLGIPGSPLASDVSAAIGNRDAWRAQLDSLMPGTVGAKSVTLGELVRTRMGEGVLEKLVAPITHGVHSRHPDDLDLDRVAPGLRQAMRREGSLARGVRSIRSASPAGSAVAGIRGGIVRIVDELVADLERLGVDIRLDSRVDSIASGIVRVRGEALVGTPVVAAPWLQGTPEPGTAITLATLVLESAALDSAPRGTGVLVARGAPGVSARALTHSTAKWSWLAERAEGMHVVRLSYDEPPADLRVAAIADASLLLGVTLTGADVIDFARVLWRRPAAADTASVSNYADSGMLFTGESATGSGLASVIAHAQATAETFLRDAVE